VLAPLGHARRTEPLKKTTLRLPLQSKCSGVCNLPLCLTLEPELTLELDLEAIVLYQGHRLDVQTLHKTSDAKRDFSVVLLRR
jgi:hypothetical protein